MDTVGDFLTRIRNAGMARHDKVDVPSSNVRVGIARVLQEAGYIRRFKVAKDGKQGLMRVYLRYNQSGKHFINKMHRVSTPGKRVHLRSSEIPKVRSGFGLSILSTNKGIMSGEEASSQNVGGEILCKIW